MVIPIIVRGAGIAARGAKGLKGATGKVANVAQQGWQGAQNIGGVIQSGWQNMPGSGKIGLMTGLAASGLKKGHEIAKEHISQKSALILIVPIMLTILDAILNINGVPLNFFRDISGALGYLLETLGRIGTSAPYWAAVIIYWIVRKPHETGEWLYPFFLFMLGFFILAASGMGFWVFYHCVFALFTFAYLLDGFNSDVRISTAHWIFLIILFMDIFGLATIGVIYDGAKLEVKDVPGALGTESITISFIFFNRLLFPYWFFFYLFFVRGGTTKTITSILLTGFYTGYALTSIIGVGAAETTDLGEQTEEAKNAVVKAIDNWRDQIASWLTGRIQYAVTGKVEENQHEPLGVSLDNVQSADPRFYEDEDIIIYGTVKARTLDDPIHLKVGCFVRPEKNKIYADKTDPDRKFSVFTLEENDFACTFGSCKDEELRDDLSCKNPCNPQKEQGCKTVVERGILKTGTNTIKAFADFNFETLAFLKVYFMNRERQRAMARQGLDPFEEFAIEDRNPIAIYTNGPAKILMGTNNPLISVSEDYTVEPSLDIKIDNREGWQGEIKMLKELVMFLPEGIIFDGKQSCGSMKFLDYGENDCKTKSCVKFVKNECLEVCNGFIDNPSSCDALCKDKEFEDDCIKCKSDLSNSYGSCADDCIETFVKCQTTCSSFFAEGGQLYKGYILDTNDIKYRNEETDFKKGKLFRCRFRPDPEKVLGASPFTTKSFRVKARYNYSLEESVSVQIDEVPKEEKSSIGPPRNLRIKDKDGKLVQEGSISLGNEITIVWDLSVNDDSGSKNVIGYRIYRKEKLEDNWDKIGDVLKGESQFIDNSEKVRNAIASGNFKFYYHIESVDKDGKWEKSEKMLEITPGKVATVSIAVPTGTPGPVPAPSPSLPPETPKLVLGETCYVLDEDEGIPEDCHTALNNEKCQSEYCGWIQSANECRCAEP